jgi:hypothetical protein
VNDQVDHAVTELDAILTASKIRSTNRVHVIENFR